MTTTITSFPGEKVDQHLKRYGHLPGDEKQCCARETYDEARQHFNSLLDELLSEVGEEVYPTFKIDSQLEYGAEMLRFTGKNEEKARVRAIINHKKKSINI